MTENEAKYYLLEHKPIVGFKTHNEALDIAIQALEEIQQYKAIGLTPELIEAMQGHNVALINDLGEYQAIGTVEECRVAVEKQVAKKPVDKIMFLECPNCGDVGILDCLYCSCCGQKLDWEGGAV